MNYATVSAIVFVVAFTAYFITLHLVKLTESDGCVAVWKAIWLACLIGLCFIVAATPPPVGSALKALIVMTFALCFFGHISAIIAVEYEQPTGM